MNTPVTYSRNGGINIVWAVGIFLLALIVGVSYRSITSSESMSGHEIPADDTACVTAYGNGSATVEEVTRQAVALLAPNSTPISGEPVNMKAAIAEAEYQQKSSGPLPMNMPITACPGAIDANVVASIGVGRQPVNLGGR